jgi:tripartite-type tricarboxylate transporter receptor subunit TctC
MKGVSRALVAAILAVVACLVAAQGYPAKPVRIIVPFPPGGGTDILGRYLGLRLSETLGQQVLVDNRGGANGTLGLELASKAPPDGYTLAIGQTGNLTISPSLVKVGYDPARDFAPITLLVSSPLVITIHPSLPVRSLKELVALAKKRPGELSYASSGSGSPGHLSVEMLKKMAGIDMVHIPYKGAAPGFTDLVAGHVQLYFTSMLSAQQFVKSGRVRVLASGGAKRSPSAPDLPTVAESGYPGFDAANWWGLLGPVGMAREIVARVNAEMLKIMKTPDARSRMAAMDTDIVAGTPEQFAAYIASETLKWGRIIRESGARVD